MSKPTVLFVCIHNAGRSQMAAGFLRHLAGDRVEVLSAGSAPAASINPVAAQAVPAAPSRYALLGVYAGRDSGGGAAVIAVGGQPAKAYKVGAQVDEGLVLQSLSAREARLGASPGGPASMTLNLVVPGAR